jgi:hypothetical protein
MDWSAGTYISKPSIAQLQQCTKVATDSTWKCPSAYAQIVAFCEPNTVRCPSSQILQPMRQPTLVPKGKAVPLQAWKGPQGSTRLRPPNFLTSAQGCQPYAPAASTPWLTWYSFSEAESTPEHVELSDATEKTPAIPGIDPGTFWIVAQYLNHYATPGPPCAQKVAKYITYSSNAICKCADYEWDM